MPERYDRQFYLACRLNDADWAGRLIRLGNLDSMVPDCGNAIDVGPQTGEFRCERDVHLSIFEIPPSLDCR